MIAFIYFFVPLHEISNITPKKMAKELGSVVDYVATLNEVDTSNIEPTEHILQVSNVFRDDVVGTPLSNQVALANAPDQENGCFKVPRVLD